MKNQNAILIGLGIFLCLVIVVSTAFDPYPRGWTNYDEEWMIGKTAGQVQKRYGEFDRCYNYRGSEIPREAHYVLRPRKYWQYQDGLWLEIYFDENGVVSSVREAYGRQGG